MRHCRPPITYLESEREQHGQTNHEEDENTGHALFTHAQELGSFAGRRRFRLLLQRHDVGDRQDGSGHEPGQAQQRTGADQQRYDQQV